MMLVGRLSGKVDPRLMVFFGLTLATYTLYLMVGWTPDTPARTIAIDSVGQGVGLGFVFVPLNTIAFATLPGALRTDGAALWTLIRNLGSSVGISLMVASLTNDMSKFHSQLAEFINPFNDGLRMPDVVGRLTTAGRGLAAFEAMVTQQAAIMAYSNAFLTMTFVSLAAFPLLALIRSARSASAAASQREAAHAAVMD
jgi:DHA2 family multidrug resistance protein